MYTFLVIKKTRFLMLQQMFVAPIRRMIRAVPGNMVLVDAGSFLTILLTTLPPVQHVKKWVEKYQIHSIIKHLHSLLSDSCNTQVSYTVFPTLFSYCLILSLQNGLLRVKDQAPRLYNFFHTQLS